MWLNIGSLIVVFFYCACEAAAWNVQIYQTKDGVLSTKLVYTTLNCKRLITRKEFSANGVVYLVVASPTSACTTKIRQPPELLVASSAVPKWILLVDNEPCADGLYPKIHNAQQKGYDGVIMYSLQPDKSGKQSSPVEIPRHIEESVTINVDVVGFNDGVQLKKFDFRARSSNGRYFLKFVKALPGQDTRRPERSSRSVPTEPHTKASDGSSGFTFSDFIDLAIRFKDFGLSFPNLLTDSLRNLIILVFICFMLTILFLSPCIFMYYLIPQSPRIRDPEPVRAEIQTARAEIQAVRAEIQAVQPVQQIRSGTGIRGIAPVIPEDCDVFLPAYNTTVSAQSLELRLTSTIAQGEFGLVSKVFVRFPGAVNSTLIAIKQIKGINWTSAANVASRSAQAACLVQEIDILRAAPNHDNIVAMLGFSTSKAYLMMEFCESGDLRTLVRRRQHSWRDLNGHALGVARGMHHLHDNKIIHRDLAARNILVHKGVAKIADFGMARETTGDVMSFYLQAGNERVPIKWLAPEAHQGLFSTYSDVWAFGILLWEAFSAGQEPYPEILDTAELVRRLAQEYRMPKPAGCPDNIYRIMLECWQTAFQRRPTAPQLIDELRHIQGF